MIQEAPAAVFLSLPAPERAPYNSSQGSENRGSACGVGDTPRTSKYPILTVYRRAPSSLRGVIPEIDIWRVANLMLKRYGDRARQESVRHADELWAAGDATGEVIWLRIDDVIGQLANTTPPGPLH
jgi:hypothetical protein